MDRLKPGVSKWRVLLASRMETVDIATRTMVSERTAKSMVAGLLHKLRVSNWVAGGRFGLLDDLAGGTRPIISWLIRHASSRAGPRRPCLAFPCVRGFEPFRA